MTPAIRTLRAAAEELTEAVRWYEAQRSGLGAELLDAVVETTGRIQAHPDSGTPEVGGTRRVPVTGFPYQVVYRSLSDGIVIVAVAHSKRRPGYWSGRR